MSKRGPKRPEGTHGASTGISFDCPFCGRAAGANTEAVTLGDPAFENPRFAPPVALPGTFHSMPPCPKFLELEPEEFLRAVRLKTVREMKS